MNSGRIPMTPLGKKMLEEKLKHLKSVERPRIIAAIEEARCHGDLSENAEYDVAKEKQLQISKQIQEIEHKLSLATVVNPSTIASDKVVFGATVKLRPLQTRPPRLRDAGSLGGRATDKEEIVYFIVGVDEADLNQGKISIESPVARALIGKQEGDEVKVRTPNGLREFEITSVVYR